MYSLLTRKATVSRDQLIDIFSKPMDHCDFQHPAALEKVLNFVPLIPEFSSCYAHYASISDEHQDNGEPLCTTSTRDWNGTLDYIFIHGCRVNGLLELPKMVQVAPGIPNETFPSDHVPLMAGLDLL